MKNSIVAMLFIISVRGLAATAMITTSMPAPTPKPKATNADLFKVGRKLLSFQFGLGYSSYDGFLFGLDLNPQKFVTKRIAVGIRGFYREDLNFEQYGVGPTVADYFWSNNYLRSFVEQDALYTHYTGSSKLGYNFQGNPNALVGQSYLGVGWSVIDLLGGYQYATSSSTAFIPGSFWGVRISMFL